MRDTASTDTASASDPDSGLAALCVMLRVLGLPADPAALAHAAAGARFDAAQIVRSARGLKLKADTAASNIARLPFMALPAIAEARDGSFFILAKTDERQALIQNPLTTLDVLLIGLIVVSIFETLLTALRTYLFSRARAPS